MYSCRHEKTPHHFRCLLLLPLEKYAEHWCSLLTQQESTFAKCHAMVDPDIYYKVLHSWHCMT